MESDSYARLRDPRHPDQSLRHFWLSGRAADEPGTSTPSQVPPPRNSNPAFRRLQHTGNSHMKMNQTAVLLAATVAAVGTLIAPRASIAQAPAGMASAYSLEAAMAAATTLFVEADTQVSVSGFGCAMALREGYAP